MLTKIRNKKKANAILEYAVVIAIIIGVMAAMHHVIRRGAQANIQRLTDSGIGEYPTGSLPESAEEKHKRIDDDTTVKREYLGGSTVTAITDDDLFYNYNIAKEGEVGKALDVVDYAIKPMGFAYPDAVYIVWDMHWPREGE